MIQIPLTLDERVSVSGLVKSSNRTGPGSLAITWKALRKLSSTSFTVLQIIRALVEAEKKN
jgi:hypothetical protein